MKITPAFCMSVALTVVLGVSLFVVSQENQKQRHVLSQLNKSIQAKQEHRMMLEAEWAYLNKPERLEKMMAGLVNDDVESTDKVASTVMAALPKVVMISPPPRKPRIATARRNVEPVKDIAMVLSEVTRGMSE